MLICSNMNVSLSDVIVTDPNGNRHVCDNFFLKSRLIRYVHLSRTVSLRIKMFTNSFGKFILNILLG